MFLLSFPHCNEHLQLDFDRLDADGDGLISQEELANAMAGPAAGGGRVCAKQGAESNGSSDQVIKRVQKFLFFTVYFLIIGCKLRVL